MIDDLKEAAKDPLAGAYKELSEVFDKLFGDLPVYKRAAIFAVYAAMKMMNLCTEAELEELKKRGEKPNPLTMFIVTTGAMGVMDTAIKQYAAKMIAKEKKE